MAFEQLHEKFAIEYKALLHNVASSASRTNSADGRIPDRVNFSFSSKYVIPCDKYIKLRNTALLDSFINNCRGTITMTNGK